MTDPLNASESPSRESPAPSREPIISEATATGLPPLRPYFAEIRRRKSFIWHLARSQLKGENYDTVMGQVWLLLNPILLAAVFLLVRSVLRPPSGEDVPAIMARLVMGVFFFRFVSGGVTSGARAILGNRPMILNTPFPRLIFPITVVIKQFMEFLPAIAVYLGVHAVVGLPWGWGLVWLPFIVVCQTLMMLGMASLAAPVSVLVPDSNSLIQTITRMWLYATPVLYSVAEIPDNLLPYLQWNPLFVSFSALETIFAGEMPHADDLLGTMAWALGFFFIGVYYFLRKEPKLAARL